MSENTINPATVIAHIRLKIPTLSEKEQQVIKDILSLGATINRYSIREIAEKHAVSPALIVKIAQHCGFSGFKELKNALVDYSKVTNYDLHKELDPSDDARTVVEKVFKTSINALQETLSIFDFNAIAEAANIIKTAKSIEIWGVAGSGALAFDAYHKFLRIGIRTNYCSDSHLMVMNATLLSPENVVIGISHSGRSFAIVEAFRIAKIQKATTIAITNSAYSPLCGNSDIVLCSVAQGSPITGENAAARIVQLNIIDALFVLVAQGCYEESLKNLDKTIKSVASLRV